MNPSREVNSGSRGPLENINNPNYEENSLLSRLRLLTHQPLDYETSQEIEKICARIYDDLESTSDRHRLLEGGIQAAIYLDDGHLLFTFARNLLQPLSGPVLQQVADFISSNGWPKIILHLDGLRELSFPDLSLAIESLCCHLFRQLELIGVSVESVEEWVTPFLTCELAFRVRDFRRADAVAATRWTRVIGEDWLFESVIPMLEDAETDENLELVVAAELLAIRNDTDLNTQEIVTAIEDLALVSAERSMGGSTASRQVDYLIYVLDHIIDLAWMEAKHRIEADDHFILAASILALMKMHGEEVNLRGVLDWLLGRRITSNMPDAVASLINDLGRAAGKVLFDIYL